MNEDDVTQHHRITQQFFCESPFSRFVSPIRRSPERSTSTNGGAQGMLEEKEVSTTSLTGKGRFKLWRFQ
jgi:hypothetical protein